MHKMQFVYVTCNLCIHESLSVYDHRRFLCTSTDIFVDRHRNSMKQPAGEGPDLPLILFYFFLLATRVCTQVCPRVTPQHVTFTLGVTVSHYYRTRALSAKTSALLTPRGTPRSLRGRCTLRLCTPC